MTQRDADDGGQLMDCRAFLCVLCALCGVPGMRFSGN